MDKMKGDTANWIRLFFPLYRKLYFDKQICVMSKITLDNLFDKEGNIVDEKDIIQNLNCKISQYDECYVIQNISNVKKII